MEFEAGYRCFSPESGVALSSSVMLAESGEELAVIHLKRGECRFFSLASKTLFKAFSVARPLISVVRHFNLPAAEEEYLKSFFRLCLDWEIFEVVARQPMPAMAFATSYERPLFLREQRIPSTFGLGATAPSIAQLKEEISYLDNTERKQVSEEIFSLRLARFKYKEDAQQFLGFLIDDIPQASFLTSDGTRVISYSYISAVVAALQELRREIDQIKASL